MEDGRAEVKQRRDGRGPFAPDSAFIILHSAFHSHSPLPRLELDEFDQLVAVDPPERLALDLDLGLTGHAGAPGADGILQRTVDLEDVLAFLVRRADRDDAL